MGGAADYPTNGVAYRAYQAYVTNNPDAAAVYFQWNQGDALAQWIDANKGNVVVYGHSWGAATAADVVASGHSVTVLVTVDPVSWFRPNFQAVADHAGIWLDFNATGSSGMFDWANIVAGLGGAWNAAPAPYSTCKRIPFNHVGATCAVAPNGCYLGD